jgi:hypothetical protein
MTDADGKLNHMNLVYSKDSQSVQKKKKNLVNNLPCRAAYRPFRRGAFRQPVPPSLTRQ